MNRRHNRFGTLGLVMGLMAMILTGCKTPQNVTLFQDAMPQNVIQMAGEKQLVARPGDKLVIVVKTKDPGMSALFNMPVYSARVDNMASPSSGANTQTYVPDASQGVASYTIGPDGKIDFPLLGMLKISGMTRQEIAGFIKGELMGRDLVKDPTVAVEFLNAGISILGDVARPGRYESNRDMLTITDALALAGDITLQGRRDNVKVMRKENGQVRTYTVDLTSAASTMGSPAYYLQQDDIVYVEPNDMRKRSTTNNGNSALSVSFWISVASLLTTVVTTIGVFVVK